MKYVFLDQFGCFASLVAALYAAGNLPAEVNYHQVLMLLNFAGTGHFRPGKLTYRARDKEGNEYYTLSAGVYGSFIKNILGPEILKMVRSPKQIVLYDLSGLNLWLLNLLEFFLPGRLRKLSQKLWAYYLCRRMPLLVRSIKGLKETA